MTPQFDHRHADNRPYSRCQILKLSIVCLNRASYGRRLNNDVTSQEREATMMLCHDLRTDAQICGKSATQASLFVRHGRGVNRVYDGNTVLFAVAIPKRSFLTCCLISLKSFSVSVICGVHALCRHLLLRPCHCRPRPVDYTASVATEFMTLLENMSR